jgi:hypothetical protein
MVFGVGRCAMTSNKSKTIIIHIKVEEGREGLFYATSPDIRGLLVAEPDLESLEKAIPLAIQEMYAVCGVRAIVTPASSSEDEAGEYQPWVAIPYDVARRALSEQNDSKS